MVIDQNDNSDKKQMHLSDILTKDELDDNDCNTLFENCIEFIDLLYRNRFLAIRRN